MVVAAPALQQIAERRDKVQEFQRSHRVAVLTLVFTDIVGSTKLKQELGDQEAVSAIQRHHAAIREILSRFGQGEEVVRHRFHDLCPKPFRLLRRLRISIPENWNKLRTFATANGFSTGLRKKIGAPKRAEGKRRKP